MNKVLFIFLLSIATPLSPIGLETYILLQLHKQKRIKYTGACKGCGAMFKSSNQKKWLRKIAKHQIEKPCKRGPILHILKEGK